MPPIHEDLLTDAVRMETYREALRRTVRPGDVVLDLGAGTGVLSFFALQAGAARVYAVESDATIAMARQLAALNAPPGRLHLIHDRSTRAQLPEKVDLIVSDILGSFGLDEGLLTFVSDARERFLKPGGRLVPSRLRLFLAPVSLPEFYRHAVEWWGSAPYGLDLSPQRELAVNACHVVQVPAAAMLAPPALAGDLDLHAVGGVRWDTSVSFRVSQPGVLHGLAGWFEATMAGSLTLSTAPSAPPTHWKQVLFPLGAPVEVGAGAGVRVQLWGAFAGSRDVWTWSVEVDRGKEAPAAIFTHSTRLGYPWVGEAHPRSS